MTSIAGSFAKRQEGLTRFIKPESACYDESGVNRLFPFVYVNGMLDITYEGNTFEATMVDISGVSPNNEPDTVVYMMGGPRLVTSIGENFKAYIRAWRDGTIDAGSPIDLYQPSQVMRVQEADLNNITANSGESYVISEIAPVSDFFTAGAPANNYYTTFVFKTPLTVTILEGGVTKYITFRTVLDQE
jgi:hypothetical protein